MSTATLTPVAPTVVLDETRRFADDDLCHLYCCCNPDLALCGTDLTDEPEDDDEDDDDECVVCADLAPIPCPRCGYGLDGPCFCGRCGS